MPPSSPGDYSRKVMDLSGHRVGRERPSREPLQPPGGGGTYDGMEARVARLESDVEHIKSDIGEMKQSLRTVQDGVSELRIAFARIDERVAHLPSKGFLIACVLAALTVLAAITVFQDNMRKSFSPQHPTVAAPAATKG